MTELVKAILWNLCFLDQWLLPGEVEGRIDFQSTETIRHTWMRPLFSWNSVEKVMVEEGYFLTSKNNLTSTCTGVLFFSISFCFFHLLSFELWHSVSYSHGLPLIYFLTYSSNFPPLSFSCTSPLLSLSSLWSVSLRRRGPYSAAPVNPRSPAYCSQRPPTCNRESTHSHRR